MILVLTYAKKYTSSGSKKILYLSKHINVLKMYNNKINIFLTYLDALQEKKQKTGGESDEEKKSVAKISLFNKVSGVFNRHEKTIKNEILPVVFFF